MTVTERGDISCDVHQRIFVIAQIIFCLLNKRSALVRVCRNSRKLSIVLRREQATDSIGSLL